MSRILSAAARRSADSDNQAQPEITKSLRARPDRATPRSMGRTTCDADSGGVIIGWLPSPISPLSCWKSWPNALM